MIETMVVVSVVLAFGLIALCLVGIVVVLSGVFDDGDAELAKHRAKAQELVARRSGAPYPSGVESSIRDWDSAA